MDYNFEVTLWGTRGSCAVNGPSMMQYGCNTSCVSVRCGEHILLIDGGTGLVNYEKEYYLGLEEKPDFHLFLSHYHYDHIEGIPFLKSLFDGRTHFYFYGKDVGEEDCGTLLSRAFSPPYFPIHFVNKESRKRMHFIALKDYHTYQPFDGVAVETIPVNHPGGANVFKVRYGNKSFCYISDYEYEEATFAPLKKLIDHCDLLLLDTYFSEETYEKGWGHSTWERGVVIAKEMNVGRLVLYHHHTDCDDQMLDALGQKAAQVATNIVVGRDRMVLKV